METILITVSVLSTLGVVAIVLSITNVLNKLKGKVDVGTMNDIENNYRLIDRNVEDIHNIYDRKIEVLEDIISKVDKRIDSRSDKLVDHMCREFNVVHEKLDNKKDSNLKLLKD
jgi:hypothetical protein